ncbi:MAG: cation diffusion facilitator family transporter [Wujia sp.]
MIDFLVKHFVKDYEDVKNPVVRERYGMFSSIVGIICNMILCISKIVIGMLAHSIAILSDGVNNLSDCATCIVTMFGYKMAAKPADKDHPFGHGRMEYLTSLVIATAILLVGFELLKSSVGKILHPEKVVFSVVALLVLMISIVIKIWMGMMNRRLGNRVDSSIMLATSQDSFSDVIATSATMVALIASIWVKFPIDGLMGVAVSVMILLSGYGIVKETVDELLGAPADEEMVNALRELIEESHVAQGMHDLMIHSYGPGNLIGSVHVEVDSHGDIMEIHDAIDELERNIYEELHIRMTIHMDPLDLHDERSNACKELVTKLLKKMDENLSLHDFRMIAGPTHTNLIFDVVIPYDCALTQDEIRKKLAEELSKEEVQYYAVITFDKSYC